MGTTKTFWQGEFKVFGSLNNSFSTIRYYPPSQNTHLTKTFISKTHILKSENAARQYDTGAARATNTRLAANRKMEMREYI